MGLLNKEFLLTKQPIKIEKVFLSKKDFVFVKEMTGGERDSFEQSIVKIVDGKPVAMTADYRAKLAVQTVCDNLGNNLFQSEDYKQLSDNMKGSQLETIINVAQRLNRIRKEDEDELVKNSEGGISAASTSDSVKS